MFSSSGSLSSRGIFLFLLSFLEGDCKSFFFFFFFLLGASTTLQRLFPKTEQIHVKDDVCVNEMKTELSWVFIQVENITFPKFSPSVCVLLCCCSVCLPGNTTKSLLCGLSVELLMGNSWVQCERYCEACVCACMCVLSACIHTHTQRDTHTQREKIVRETSGAF